MNSAQCKYLKIILSIFKTNTTAVSLATKPCSIAEYKNQSTYRQRQPAWLSPELVYHLTSLTFSESFRCYTIYFYTRLLCENHFKNIQL